MNNRFIILILMTALFGSTAQRSQGQDMIPTSTLPEMRMAGIRQLNPYKLTPDTIATQVLLPEAFQYTKPSAITDNGNTLQPIMKRLHRLRLGMSEDTLRIVHIGDSHVRGRTLPGTVRTRLTEMFGAISYTDMGVNGATCLTFTHPDRIGAIAGLQPGLLVLSFGTNESHNRRYNSTVHYHQIDELVKLLRSSLPGIPILLTTPPGSYESFRQRRRRRTYSVNPRTETAVNTIRKYGEDRKLAVWDMYNIVGGKDHACTNWWDAGLMRPDHVHYITEGYALQGELLFKALINTYNEYVAD